MNGIIGSALYKHLQQSAAVNVVGTTQREGTSEANVSYLNLAEDPSKWRLPSTQFDAAFLCAGISRMAQCENEPLATQKVNVEGMTRLIKLLADSGTFIIYLSTNQVFSGEIPLATPDTSYQPRNEYGRQKVNVEEFIKAHCKRFAIVRLTKVIEPNAPLIKGWIERLREQQPIDAFLDLKIAPVSLRQVIACLVKIAQIEQTGCYQLSGIEDVSYYEIANYLVDKLRRPLSLVKASMAIEKGINKIFLPAHTSLDATHTNAFCGEKSPHYVEVLAECFNL